MILDEATSAVNIDTDRRIQQSIREEFVDSTLLVIAHTLNTIVDIDKILAMDDGKTVEFASPRELMQIEHGIFWGMIEQSGDAEQLKPAILGELGDRWVTRPGSVLADRNWKDNEERHVN